MDLSHRTLTVGARSVAVTAGRWPSSVSEGRMTVTAREEVKVMPAMALGLRSTRIAELRWLVEFRGDDGTTLCLSSMPSVSGEPGHADRTHDWIAFAPADARCLYGQLRPGDVVDVTSD
ncbi:hypothetical protein [Streptomyces sp. NPDC004783]|uniref:hypothetical protein n=1 Tax=Streptomyces sp. NPDC004783 TaxID=3154459 RepID=UPI0033AA389C